MAVESPVRVSNVAKILKRMSLSTNELPSKKRQRMWLQLPHKLCGKRKRMSLTASTELHGNRRGISMLPETRELPEEIIRAEILPRLPIKSVVRFKCVGKSWLSIFSDPRFVKEHGSCQNTNDYDCLVADTLDNIVILSCYQEEFVLSNDLYRLIGCAKGLVCMCRGKILSMWNPAIHQSKEFHLPSLGYRYYLHRAGFGFDHLSNDYKVGICYSYYATGKSHLCYAVYSSNSESWIHHQFDDPDYEIFKFKHSLTPTTMVKDSPYWTTWKTCYTFGSMSDIDNIILSLDAHKFDATSNKFKLLPKFSIDISKEKTFKFLNMRDLLTLMVYEPCPFRNLDVYSLDEEKECGGGGGVWTKMYCFGPFEQFWHFRHLLPDFKHSDEIVFYENGSFDHRAGTFECIPGTKPVTMRDCFTYTPSLVSLQGMTSIYSENQTPPLGHHSTTPLRLKNSLRHNFPV